jgi:hypothetical protein
MSLHTFDDITFTSFQLGSWMKIQDQGMKLAYIYIGSFPLNSPLHNSPLDNSPLDTLSSIPLIESTLETKNVVLLSPPNA